MGRPTGSVTVFPTPGRVELTGDAGDLSVIGTAEDHRLRPQGYRLRVTPTGTTIDHRDELGLRYARDTLRQLAGATTGTGIVEDAPAFTERGYMLDVSRDRVPTWETLEWLVGLLGRLRYTELQLYTEHTFAWRDHEVVWRDASPLTAEEMARLADLCRGAGLRLVPCLNGFGHMERFLRHDAYRHRAECPAGAPAVFGDGIVPPTTLAPTPENAAFTLELFREVLQAVPSDRVHAGGDEPFELGHGRSADEVARRGRTAVYAEHLARIIRPLVDDGHEVLFWGDMLVREPAAVTTLPAGSTAVAWWYQAPVADPPPVSRVFGAEIADRLGLPDDALAGFAAHTRTFADTGFPFWVAPGTSSWNSLVGRWPNARANIDDAVGVGLDRGARGILLTDWGDNGHHQPLACSLPAIVHHAGATWCPAEHDPAVVDAVIDGLLGVPVGHTLLELATVDEQLGVRQFNAGAVHHALLGTLRVPRRAHLDTSRVERALAVLDAGARLDLPGDERAAIVQEEVRAASRLARVGVHRLASALGVSAPTADTEMLTEAVAAQQAAWLRSSRPGGLADSVARLTGA